MYGASVVDCQGGRQASPLMWHVYNLPREGEISWLPIGQSIHFIYLHCECEWEKRKKNGAILPAVNDLFTPRIAHSHIWNGWTKWTGGKMSADSSIQTKQSTWKQPISRQQLTAWKDQQAAKDYNYYHPQLYWWIVGRVFLYFKLLWCFKEKSEG